MSVEQQLDAVQFFLESLRARHPYLQLGQDQPTQGDPGRDDPASLSFSEGNTEGNFLWLQEILGEKVSRLTDRGAKLSISEWRRRASDTKAELRTRTESIGTSKSCQEAVQKASKDQDAALKLSNRYPYPRYVSNRHLGELIKATNNPQTSCLEDGGLSEEFQTHLSKTARDVYAAFTKLEGELADHAVDYRTEAKAFWSLSPYRCACLVGSDMAQ